MNGMPMTAARRAVIRKPSDRLGCPFSGLAGAFWNRVLQDERTAEMHELRSKDGVGQVLVVAGAVFGVALLSAGVASAADPVQLKSRLGNWCLDGPGGNNSAMVVNPCNGS